MANPAEANKMLGASGSERAIYEAKVRERDNKRNPLSDEQLKLLLTKGRKQVVDTGGEAATSRNTLSVTETQQSGGWNVFVTQMRVLLWKRRHQLDRSRGQWAFSLLMPIGLVVLLAILITQVPTDIVASNPSVTDTDTITTYVSSPIAANTSVDATAYGSAAGLDSIAYTGTDYNSLYGYIENQSDYITTGDNSIAGVYFNSQNNFTVMYNATASLNLPAVVNGLLQSAVSTYTGSKLLINTICQPLPASAIGDQANFGIMFAFVMALFSGSLGGGMSIVLSGERVGLVKHQQL